jgi:phenylacetate-coenzyme A ligase PaaK-like adenylate-forming protein
MIDAWIKAKIGLPGHCALTRESIEAWQADRLRRTLAHMVAHSPFYSSLLSGISLDKDILSISDACKLPFTDEDDLTRDGHRMVCTSASEVSRIVTLPTSGTTGAPKRIFFTEADQELMIDYIHHGLAIMAGAEDVFLVLMPCERPGSVGDLVRIGLERGGVRVIPRGILPFDGSRDAEMLDMMEQEGISSLLATASAALRLSEKSRGRLRLRSVLLSAEYVSSEARAAIEANWGCLVYEHYGMTEMGLGGAMACAAREGYHPREADLLFEIVDPQTGAVLPDGEWGEVVFTTLTREAMPFVRYRTGDRGRFLPGQCPCGSVLKRLDRIGDRKALKGY